MKRWEVLRGYTVLWPISGIMLAKGLDFSVSGDREMERGMRGIRLSSWNPQKKLGRFGRVDRLYSLSQRKV